MLVLIFFVDQNLKNLPLSEILDINKLNNVDKSIETANGLPNECYTSKDYFVHEREKVFFNKWAVVGRIQSIVSRTIQNIVQISFLQCIGQIRIAHTACKVFKNSLLNHHLRLAVIFRTREQGNQ